MIFDRFFKTDEAEAEVAQSNLAHETLSIAEHPYALRLLAYLDLESDKLVLGTDPMEIVKSAVRAHAFKEIRRKILRDFQEAKAVVASGRE